MPGSAEARADERSAVAEAAKVASAAVDMEGEGTTAGETPGLGVGVGANVTRGLVRRAGVLDDVLAPC